MATLPGAWRYRVSAGTGRSGVSILWLGEVESLICSFYLSVAARKIVCADPSLRHTGMLLGRSATNKQTIVVSKDGSRLFMQNYNAHKGQGSWRYTQQLYSVFWARCRKEEWRKEAADIPPSKAENDLCSTRQILALFRGQPWGDC